MFGSKSIFCSPVIAVPRIRNLRPRFFFCLSRFNPELTKKAPKRGYRHRHYRTNLMTLIYWLKSLVDTGLLVGTTWFKFPVCRVYQWYREVGMDSTFHPFGNCWYCLVTITNVWPNHHVTCVFINNRQYRMMHCGAVETHL